MEARKTEGKAVSICVDDADKTADELQKWLDALAVPSVYEMSLHSIALANGECITINIKEAQIILRMQAEEIRRLRTVSSGLQHQCIAWENHCLNVTERLNGIEAASTAILDALNKRAHP